MSTRKKQETMTQEEADMEEVCRLAAEGKKVTDPELLKRIQERARRIKAASGPDPSFGAKDIREMRGPTGEVGVRELTPDASPISTGPPPPSFPRSAWECPLRRSASSGSPGQTEGTRSVPDGIPTRERGNEGNGSPRQQ